MSNSFTRVFYLWPVSFLKASYLTLRSDCDILIDCSQKFVWKLSESHLSVKFVCVCLYDNFDSYIYIIKY